MRWAIITGGALEFIDGVILVWQLGLVRTVETGAPPWLNELTEHVGNGLKTMFNRHQAVTLEGTGAGDIAFAGTATAIVSEPEPPPTNPTIAQAMAWIQRKMDATNELIEQGRRTTKQELDAANRALESLMRELLAELERAELARRVERGRSGSWQAFATVCILAGVVLSTVGSVA